MERQTESSSEFDDGCMDDFVWIPYSRAVKVARNAVINNTEKSGENMWLDILFIRHMIYVVMFHIIDILIFILKRKLFEKNHK